METEGIAKNIIVSILKKELLEKDIIYPFISGLNTREKAVLSFREGEKTLDEIGKKFRITRERVRQVEEKAKQKLSYQNEIIEKLAIWISKFVFSDQEIMLAFVNWKKSKVEDINVPDIIAEYNDFNKFLLELKQQE
jgi:hypothetical protein